LQLQDKEGIDVDALATGDVEHAKLAEKEKALLAYVKVLTLEPGSVRDADVNRLRKSGWTEEEIMEASFTTALFAFFNRMADAYGLDYPTGGWFPPAMRKNEAR
jgi:alkylhydroperoxidase family enzyme